MRFLVRLFAVIGLLSVLLVGGLVGLWLLLRPDGKPLPDGMVLAFDFQKPLVEAAPDDPFAGLVAGSQPTLVDVVAAIDRAAADPRVVGLVGMVGDSGGKGFAMTQELRDAVQRFRAAGKFTVAHAETFGELGSGMQGYYMATAFEQVWMQPMGDVSVTGLRAELPFLRGTLDKLNVVPQFEKRHEYKTFAEQYTNSEPSPANKEATESLIGDLFEQWVAGVAAARNLPVEAVRAAVDKAPLLDDEAVQAKLVDKLAFADEALDAAKAKGAKGKDTPVLDLLEYGDAVKGDPASAPPADAPKVALVVGSGPIMRGEGQVDPLSGEATFGAETVAEHFQAAIDDKDVKAILFRVDSPGGSAVASAVVGRMVERARAAGKPVVVSMGPVAASGGYWVSMKADRIVAQPGTITGSIGVVGGKMVTKGLTDWAGLNFVAIERGKNAGMWSSNNAFSPSQAERLNAFMDSTYDAFTRGVADGRKLPVEKVREIAKGRVYTGRQAKEIGLVDALGGFQTALAQVRQLVGVAPDAKLNLVPFPQPKGPFENLMALMSGDTRAEAGRAVSALVAADLLAEIRPVIAPLAPYIRARGMDETVLLMPPLLVE